MNTKIGESDYRLDSLKWLFIVAIVLGGVYANYIYAATPLWIRFASGIGITLFTVLIVINTAKGRAVWDLAKESRTELRKVIWPTWVELRQTTIIVIIAVILVAALLALIDWVLNLGIQGVIG